MAVASGIDASKTISLYSVHFKDLKKILRNKCFFVHAMLPEGRRYGMICE
jgi:hypothetical protein